MCNPFQLPPLTVSKDLNPHTPPKLSGSLSRLSHLEQIRLIMTHPFFTGQCPQCHHKLQLVDRALGQCHCNACGWSDELESQSA